MEKENEEALTLTTECQGLRAAGGGVDRAEDRTKPGSGEHACDEDQETMNFWCRDRPVKMA